MCVARAHVVCMCVCVCVFWGRTILNINNIKEGGPHGSMAPSGRLRRQLEKDKTYALSLVPARVAVGG